MKTEITTHLQIDHLRLQSLTIHFLSLHISYHLILIRQGDTLLASYDERPLAFLHDGEQSRITLEGSKTSHITILHLAHIHLDDSLASRSFHTIGQSIGSHEEILCDARSLEAKTTLALCQRPSLIVRIMIPLPLQVKLRTREIITIHHSLAVVAQHRLGHRERHISIRIPKHRPSIFPSAWLQGEHSSHSPSVLEDDAIPFAIRSIDNGTLSDTAIASELGLQDDLLLISSPDMIGTITDFTARMSPRPRNHQEVVLAIMLDHARTLQQVFLLGISLKEATMATFHHCRQVGIELHHLSCGIDDIRLVIIIKEERGIVEVRQTAMDSPLSLDVVSRADIGFPPRMVIWCKERIKFASMILQGSSPLTSTIDRAILHFILR